MIEIRVTKAFCLDENKKFPLCHLCNIELTPFCITTKELEAKIPLKTIKRFIKWKYIILDQFGNNKHLIYFCKNCSSYIKTRIIKG